MNRLVLSRGTARPNEVFQDHPSKILAAGPTAFKSPRSHHEIPVYRRPRDRHSGVGIRPINDHGCATWVNSRNGGDDSSPSSSPPPSSSPLAHDGFSADAFVGVAARRPRRHRPHRAACKSVSSVTMRQENNAARENRRPRRLRPVTMLIERRGRRRAFCVLAPPRP